MTHSSDLSARLSIMTVRPVFFALCLVPGLLTTIALAWACAAWINPEQRGPGRFTHGQVAQDRWEMITTRSRFGHTRIDRVLGDVPVSANPDGSPRVHWPIGVATFEEDGTYSRSECGWPWRALACFDTTEVTVHPPGDEPTGVELGKGTLIGGVRLSPWTPDGWPTWRALPLRPLWVGLILNTLVFAGLWALVLLGANRLRRLLRLRKGLCPQCRYDLRGGSEQRCPECGWNAT
jgi:hypothetical protein